jgi:hypothetical protein
MWPSSGAKGHDGLAQVGPAYPRHWTQRGLSWGGRRRPHISRNDHRKVAVEVYVKGMHHLSCACTASHPALDFGDIRRELLAHLASRNTGTRSNRYPNGALRCTLPPEVIRCDARPFQEL